MRLIGLLIAVCIGVGLTLMVMQSMMNFSTVPDIDNELLNGPGRGERSEPGGGERQESDAADEPEASDGPADAADAERQPSGGIPGRTRDRVDGMVDEHTQRQLDALNDDF